MKLTNIEREALELFKALVEQKLTESGEFSVEWKEEGSILSLRVRFVEYAVIKALFFHEVLESRSAVWIANKLVDEATTALHEAYNS